MEPNVGSARLVISVVDAGARAPTSPSACPSTSITFAAAASAGAGAGGVTYPPRGTLRLASAASTDWANNGESADASVLVPIACAPAIHRAAAAISIKRIKGMCLSTRLLMISLDLPS